MLYHPASHGQEAVLQSAAVERRHGTFHFNYAKIVGFSIPFNSHYSVAPWSVLQDGSYSSDWFHGLWWETEQSRVNATMISMAHAGTAETARAWVHNYIIIHPSSTTLVASFLNTSLIVEIELYLRCPQNAKRIKNLIALPVTGDLIPNGQSPISLSAFIAKDVYLHRTMGFPESVSGLWTSTCGAYFSPFAHATWFAIGLGSIFSLGRQVPPNSCYTLKQHYSLCYKKGS